MEWDEGAEKAFVGACLLDATTIDKCAVQPEHFGSVVWRAIYETVREVHASGRPLDLVLLAGELERRGAPSSVLLNLAQAAADVPTATNADFYADIIRDRWLTREVNHVADELRNLGNRSGVEMVGLLESKLTHLLVSSGSKLPTLEKVIDDELRALSNPVQVGLPTGVGLESVVPGGIPIDRVTTIFGESGSFKSTVKNAIVHAVASAGHVVVDCSFEDSNALTAARWIARDTGISYGAIAARQCGRMDRYAYPSKAAAGKVIAAGDMAPTVEEVIRVARQYKRVAGARAVVVDYVQLLEGGSSQKDTLDEAMRRFQILAKRENLAVILVSQVKQDQGMVQYRRSDPRPQVHDMLGSSALRTGTKLAIGVYRPYNFCRVPLDDDGPNSMYVQLRNNWPDGPEAFDAVYPELLELHVAKQVAGVAPTRVYARVRPETGVITPFDPRRYLDAK